MSRFSPGSGARLPERDQGREFCGKPESHPYELVLAVEGSLADRLPAVIE
jgi:hypothetical protein